VHFYTCITKLLRLFALPPGTVALIPDVELHQYTGLCAIDVCGDLLQNFLRF
jgi:hypothetical protein